MLKRGGPSRQLVAAIRLDAQVTRTTSTNSQPPSRIKTWDGNICVEGRPNQIKCVWVHHLLYISGFGDVAGRVSSSLVFVKGHTQVSPLPMLVAHAQCPGQDPEAQVRIPSFYSGGLAATRRTVEVKRHKSRTAGGDAGLSVHVERTKSTTSKR